MDYGKLSTTMNSNYEDASSSLSAVRNVSFDGVWSGSAYTTLTSDLSDTVDKADIELKNYETFSEAMDLLNQYKEKDERVKELNTLKENVYVPDSKKDPDGYSSAINKINSYTSEINTLENEKRTLRTSIESKLASITANSSDLSLVTFSVSDVNFDTDFDIESLYYMYNSGKLKMLSVGKSLYDYYDLYDENGNLIRSGKDYVEGVITDIQNKYSGREAAVNSGLAILKLASDAGIKINYQHTGTSGQYPYVPTSSVASGVDCNPYVSWCIDKGVDGGFQWRPVQNFTSIGSTIDYSSWGNALPGDVLANGGHVAMVLENNSETGEITYMHASGTSVGITITKRSYSSLKNDGYTIRDMSGVYDGSVDTDRWDAFSPYVDPDTYQRTYV